MSPVACQVPIQALGSQIVARDGIPAGFLCRIELLKPS